MKKIVLLVIVLFLAGGYFYFRSLTAGPKYSLLQAKVAVEKNDLTSFEKYVDVEAITGSLIDQLTQQKSLLAALIPGTTIAKSALTMLKPQLTQAVRKEVRHYVATGNLQPEPGRQPIISLAAIAGAVVSEDSEFKGIDYVNENGNQALVGLKFTQPKYDTTMVLEIKMINKGEHWQAVELTNTAELLKHVSRLEKTKMLKRNQ